MTVYSGVRFMSCSAIASVLDDPERQYSWVIFLNASGTLGEATWSTKMQTVYQSKYPPFVHTYEGQYGTETVVCGYVDGEDSMIVNANYDNNNSNSSTYLARAYIRQCKAVISDQLNSSGTVGWETFYCAIEDGRDVLKVDPGYPNVTILSARGHRGMKGLSPNMKLFKKTSSWSAPSTPSLRTTRFVTAVSLPSASATGYGVHTKAQSGVTDYRLIKYMPFQSGAEWLAWCKAH